MEIGLKTRPIKTAHPQDPGISPGLPSSLEDPILSPLHHLWTPYFLVSGSVSNSISFVPILSKSQPGYLSQLVLETAELEGEGKDQVVSIASSPQCKPLSTVDFLLVT